MEKPKCGEDGFGDTNVISEYITRKKKDACRLIDDILNEIGNPERISSAPLNQLSSVMGTLIDKFGADEKDKSLDGTLATLFDDFEDVR
ncbi:MAG: hypothetical protein IJW15_01910 [Clostridia bacterium]|nr:hypothetical protein [Clostridia bacterium]